jgi:hypothetical protein
MNEQPETQIPIRDFVGLRMDADPRDIPLGASVEQINCSGERMGLLQSRRGLRLAAVEETITLATIVSQ